MCGRFTQRYTWREIHDLYDLTGAARNLQAHYNIAPIKIVDVVKLADGDTTELVPMRWGLIPYWWKKPMKQLPATLARSKAPRRRKPAYHVSCEVFRDVGAATRYHR
jgi:putative SOS response-associated peptidase YedK